jgi:hypothetical protein
MKKKNSFASTERERRYPILTALDLALHHFLAVGVVIVLVAMVFQLMNYHAPQVTSQALNLTTRVMGLGID